MYPPIGTAPARGVYSNGLPRRFRLFEQPLLRLFVRSPCHPQPISEGQCLLPAAGLIRCGPGFGQLSMAFQVSFRTPVVLARSGQCLGRSRGQTRQFFSACGQLIKAAAVEQEQRCDCRLPETGTDRSLVA